MADELKRAGVLEQIGDPSIFVSLQANTPSITNARTYAHIVQQRSADRELLRFATDLRDAAYEGDAPRQRELLTLLTAFELVSDQDGARPMPIDWERLFSDEDQEVGEWLIEPVIPSGRQVALYGDAKAGKSLLALDLAACRRRAETFCVVPPQNPSACCTSTRR